MDLVTLQVLWLTRRPESPNERLDSLHVVADKHHNANLMDLRQEAIDEEVHLGGCDGVRLYSVSRSLVLVVDP